jgi:hypothetical protein
LFLDRKEGCGIELNPFFFAVYIHQKKDQSIITGSKSLDFYFLEKYILFFLIMINTRRQRTS